MSEKIKPFMERYELFLILFIGLQPVIDVFTTLCITFNINITFGVIIRFIVMFISIIYIFLKSRQVGKNYYFYYLLILFSTILFGSIYNYLYKPVFSIGEEGKFVVKVVYLYILLLTYLLAFNSIRARIQLENKLIKYFLISSYIINIVMIISIATGTSLTSYDYTKVGYTGWFFAGNEIGAILAICFPIILLYSISNTNSIKDVNKWIPTALTIFSMLAVGTKVGYGAAVLVLMIGLFMGLIELFKTKGTPTFNIIKLKTGFVGVILFLLIAITPFTPIYKNTFAHLSLLGIELPSNDGDEDNTKTKVDAKAKEKQKKETINKQQMENLLLSSRELYLQKHKDDFAKAPLFQKLFGMGYAGNYTKAPKMIEMDFYDLLFSFGIIGTLVLFLPLIYCSFKLIKYALFNLKKVFITKYALYFSSIILALGIAFTAGHVLTAPAVSLYIAAILAFFIIDLKIKI